MYSKINFVDNLVFLDTETTGNNLLTDRLFQVCYSFNGKIYSEYFKPPIPISIKAQSITHVTNKMVEDKTPFADSKMKRDLQQLLESHILIAHNAVFDICMLSHEGVEVKKFICTLRVARFLDEELLIPEYNLQYLRYFHQFEIEADAHEAQGDVLVLKALFGYLYAQMLQKYQDAYTVISKMIEISQQPSIFKVFSFGKYKGQKIEEVAQTDKKYIKWMLEQKLQNNDDGDDWVFTLKHYLNIK